MDASNSAAIDVTTQKPDWWTKLKQAVRDQSGAAPLPDRTVEEWHYGDPRKFQLGDLALTEDALGYSELPRHTYPPYALEVAAHIQSEHFTIQHVLVSGNPYVISLERNESAGELHFDLLAESGGFATGHTVFMTAEPFATAEIYLHCSGGSADERNLHSVMVFADLAEGARVSVTRVQHYGTRTDALLREYAAVGRDAHYASAVVQLGGLNVRSETHVTLADTGSSTNMRGAYLSTGRQRFDFLTHQNHAAPHATSNLLYKGALLGKSRASYQGMITVAPDAQRTDAYQSNRALVLSGSARADSSPQLEIGANDVRCTHGSTVSNVSDTELFYMQSRGIPREVARRLLVAAFVAEVTDQIGSADVRAKVEQYVAELAG